MTYLKAVPLFVRSRIVSWMSSLINLSSYVDGGLCLKLLHSVKHGRRLLILIDALHTDRGRCVAPRLQRGDGNIERKNLVIREMF